MERTLWIAEVAGSGELISEVIVEFDEDVDGEEETEVNSVIRLATEVPTSSNCRYVDLTPFASGFVEFSQATVMLEFPKVRGV